MKRSEMIEAIVYGALSWDGLETSGVPLEEIANDVLKVCERMGMLPPDETVYGANWEPENAESMVDELTDKNWRERYGDE